MRTFLSAIVIMGSFSEGWAVEKGPLEGQPAIRRRIMLRERRFELGPTLGFTLGQPLMHSFLVGARAEYHLLDWLSFGGTFAVGVAGLGTGLSGEIEDTSEGDPACDGAEDIETCVADNIIRNEEDTFWKDARNQAAWIATVRATLTPFSGKMALFSRLFWPYDFYAFGGAGFVKTKNDAKSAASLENDGTHIGPHVGIGMHFYFHPSVAMSVELSDTFIKNNPTGRNVNLSVDTSGACAGDSAACDRVDGDDARTTGYLTVLLGVNAFLPFEAKRTK